MAIPILNHMDFQKSAEIRNVRLHNQAASGVTSPGTGQIVYDSGTVKYYNGSAWVSLSASSGTMSNWVASDGNGADVTISDGKYLKFVEGNGILIDWTDTSDGSSSDEYDLTFQVSGNLTGITSIYNTTLSIGGAIGSGSIHFDTANEILFTANNANQMKMTDGTLEPITDNDIDLGTSTKEFKDLYLDGIAYIDTLNLGGTNYTSLGGLAVLSTVAAAQIDSNAVTTAKINADAVTAAKIADDAVVTANIVDGNVTSAKIAADAINGTKVADDAIDSEHIAAGAIDTEHIAAGQVTTAKIADDAVTGAKLSNSITVATDLTVGNDLAVGGDLTVTGTTTTVNQTNLDVSDNIIGLNRGASTNANDSGLIIERGSTGDNAAIIWDESADKFIVGTTTATPSSTGDLSVTAGTLVANTVEAVSCDFTNYNLVAGDIPSLAASKITSGTFAAARIASDAITTAKILNANVTTAKIAADAITGAKIADDAVDSEHLAADSIDTEHYAAGSVDTTALGADAVTGAKIADDAVDSEHLVNGSVDNVHLAGSIANAKLANSSITIDGSAISLGGSVTTNNTQLSTAAALIDVSAMAGNSTASFTHSLGSKNLIVQMYDTTSGLIVHADVDHTSNNAISITFANTGTELVALGIGDIRVVVIDAKNGVSDSTVSYS